MIVYNLRCAKGHAFEGWFGSIAAFDEQQAGGKLLCPLCNSKKVTKAPMAPRTDISRRSAWRSCSALP